MAEPTTDIVDAPVPVQPPPCLKAHWSTTLLCFLHGLLQLVDTNPGHMIVLMTFYYWGWKMFYQDATAGGQIMTGAWAALLVLLTRKRDPKPGETTPPQ